MSKLDIAILAGAESKAWLAGFTKQVDRLEALATKLGGKPVAATTEYTDDEPADDEDFETPAPAAKKAKPATAKKAAAPVEDTDFEDEDFTTEAAATDEDEDFEETPAPAKKAKAKKITSDQLNDAAKALAGRTNRAEVLGRLKKHFKTASISEIPEEQYEKALKVLKA